MVTLHSSAAIASVTIIFAVIILSVSAQAPAPSFSGIKSPSPGTSAPTPTTGINDCTTPLFNMSDCLSYVQMPSNATVPDKNCCPELAGLIDSNPICLCELLSNSSLTESYGIKIDVNRALKLPSVCRLQTPPVSLCSAAGYPVPGPIASSAPKSDVAVSPPGISPLPFSPAPTIGVESPTSLEPFAPAPTTGTNDCVTPLLNMSDCLSYVQMSSNATVPDKNCCPELAGLIDSNPICLCQLLSNTSLTESYGFKIDISRALKLPSVCKLQTPPVSTCSAAGYPVPGPTASDVSIPPGVQPPGGLASSPSSEDKNEASNVGSSAKAFVNGLSFSFIIAFLL